MISQQQQKQIMLRKLSSTALISNNKQICDILRVMNKFTGPLNTRNCKMTHFECQFSRFGWTDSRGIFFFLNVELDGNKNQTATSTNKRKLVILDVCQQNDFVLTLQPVTAALI